VEQGRPDVRLPGSLSLQANGNTPLDVARAHQAALFMRTAAFFLVFPIEPPIRREAQ
jgi:hypothetical protein